MDGYMQAVACALIAALLCVVLGSRGRDITLMLSICACCMVIAVAVGLLQPVINTLLTLTELSQTDQSLLKTLLKAVGLGMVGQIAALICNDSGSSALGRSVEIVSVGAVLALTMPLVTKLLELMQNLMGAV